MSDLLIPNVKNREEFRAWLAEHAQTERECWLCVKRGKPTDEKVFYYLDAVEEALCFGWIDSTQKSVNGVRLQRFSPRGKNSNWTELNKERVRRLKALGFMTEQGLAVFPPDNRPFRFDEEIVEELKKRGLWEQFTAFPPLYQRIRVSNVAFYRKRDPKAYATALKNLIDHTQKGELFGEWNDYGRLL